MSKMKTYWMPEQEEVIPPEPNIERIPVKINTKTTILIKKGCNIEEHVNKFKNREISIPGHTPWNQ